MGLYEDIYEELEKLLNINNKIIDLQEIQHKDGIYLYRMRHGEKSYVLKYFINKEFRREIENYFILQECDIPTIKVIASTEKSLLLDDLSKNKVFRLGIEEDLSDIEVVKNLAKWYLKLHHEGSKYLSKKKSSFKFYRETDIITQENLKLIRQRSNTEDNNVWKLIENNFESILKYINNLEETLVYNDFYYTNLAVAKDKKQALMFDYNFLGIGYRYSDIRNVCSSLSEEASEVFKKEYGYINEKEVIVDSVLTILQELILAYKKPIFPKWGEESIKKIKDGTLERNIQRLLSLILN